MYYTLEKTAEILELQPGDVNRLREQGKLRAFRDGANWKFRKEDVEKYLTDLIRERSKPAASNLLNDSDEELPTMLADSASFDSMIEASADAFVHNNEQDQFALDNGLGLGLSDGSDNSDFELSDESSDVGLTLANEESAEIGLALADEDKTDVGLTLADEDKTDVGLALANDESADDGLTLADDDDSASVLAFAEDEDAGSGLALMDDGLELAPEEPVALDLAKEDDSASVFDVAEDDGLHLDGDSGLALLDDVSELDGSNVGLGDDGDVLLGGSSGSGSGLNLGSDSGLALLDEAAEDFALDVAQPADDGGIFELAKEPEPAAVLELEKDADADAATVLNVATEDNFQLGANNDAPLGDALSESGSQSIPIDSNPFFTDESESTAPFDMGDVGDNPFDASESFSEVAPASSSEFDSSSSAFGGLGESGSFGGGFGESASFEGGFSTPTGDDITTEATPSEFGRTAPETQYTGKDFAFLVPCFVFLLLATIGAYELTRTIWSYENGSFDLGGPLLEMLAKMVKLI